MGFTPQSLSGEFICLKLILHQAILEGITDKDFRSLILPPKIQNMNLTGLIFI